MEKIDILTQVPIEVAQKCLLYLNVTSILKIRSVSKSWSDILRNEYFWKKLCKINKIADITRNNEMDGSKNFMDSAGISLYHERLWVYKTILNRNWLTKPLSLIQKPELEITSEVVYFDQHVTVTYGLGKFKVYNADYKLIDIFSGTCTYYNYKLVRKNNILIIRTDKYSIIVRNVTNRSYLWKRNFKTVAIGLAGYALNVDDNLIAATVRHRKVISLIDLFSGNIKVNIGVTSEVTFIEFCNKKLCYVYNGIFCVYSLENYSLLHSHLFYKNVHTYNMQLDDPYLLTISSKFDRNQKMVKLHDINQGRTIHKFPASGYIIIKNSKLIYKESKRCIKILDYNNNRNIVLEIESKYRIVTLYVNDHFIVVGCPTGIAIYDILTGKEMRFISTLELFGIQELETITLLYVSNTKIFVRISHENVEHKCILDFDVNVNDSKYSINCSHEPPELNETTNN